MHVVVKRGADIVPVIPVAKGRSILDQHGVGEAICVKKQNER